MRLFATAWWVQLRLLSRSPFFMGLVVLQPLAFATIAFFLFGDAPAEQRTLVVLGAGLLGAWSGTLYGAAESIFMQRFTGTLEPIVAAPSSLLVTAYGFAAATASLGAYAIAATWLWAAAAFGVRLHVASPGWLALSMLSALVGLSVLGVALAATYVLTRQAMTLSNLLEYPVWILAGVLVPAAALPDPLRHLGRILPLSWSVDAIERSASGESPVLPLLVSLALSAVGAVGARWLMRRFEHIVRVRGTLSLR